MVKAGLRGGGEGSRSIFLSLPKSPPRTTLPPLFHMASPYFPSEGGRGGRKKTLKKVLPCSLVTLKRAAAGVSRKIYANGQKNPKGGRRWKERAVKVKKGERKTFFPPRFFLDGPPLLFTPSFHPSSRDDAVEESFFSSSPFRRKEGGENSRE